MNAVKSAKAKIEDFVSNNTKKRWGATRITERAGRLNLCDAVQPLRARTRPRSKRKALVQQSHGSDRTNDDNGRIHGV